MSGIAIIRDDPRLDEIAMGIEWLETQLPLDTIRKAAATGPAFTGIVTDLGFWVQRGVSFDNLAGHLEEVHRLAGEMQP